MWHCLSTLTERTWAQQKKNPLRVKQGEVLPSSGGDGLPIEGKVPGPATPLLSRSSACPPSPPYGHSLIKSVRPPGRYTAGVQPSGRMCSEKHKAASPVVPLHPCGRLVGGICGHHPTPGDQGNPDGAAGKTQV